jgi:hypothetical protein
MMADVLYGKYLACTRRRRAVPPPELRAGGRRVADLDRLRRAAAAAQAGDRVLEQAGVPQYQAVFRRWTLDPKVTADQFAFKVPAGARKVELKDLAATLRSWRADARAPPCIRARAAADARGRGLLAVARRSADAGDKRRAVPAREPGRALSRAPGGGLRPCARRCAWAA